VYVINRHKNQNKNLSPLSPYANNLLQAIKKVAKSDEKQVVGHASFSLDLRLMKER
jgi:hypothetical protein